MHRIDSSTVQKDKFGPGKDGFTGGNPQTGTAATALNSDWFDSAQEEICTVIETAGIVLDKSKRNQLYAAIQKILGDGTAGFGGVKKVNNIAPDANGNVNVGTVKKVNSTAPDGDGNVNVGTVKKVNNVAPDANGNVTVSIPGQAVTSVNGKTGVVVLSAADISGTVRKVNNIGPDASGNVTISVYTQAQANARYVQGMRLSAQVYINKEGDHDQTFACPAGCVVTTVKISDGGGRDDNIQSVGYKSVQQNINGSWANIAG